MKHDHCVAHAPRYEDIPLSGIEKDLMTAMAGSLTRPDAVVEDVIVGPRFIAVVAGGRMGLSSLLGALPRDTESGMAAQAVGSAAAQVAEYILSPSPFAVCLGMAALNAANAPDRLALTDDDRPADALIAELGQGRTVGVVGDFPFTASLRERVGTLHLFELREVPDAVPKHSWDETLAGLDVLAVTGTALLTRQMGYFLSQAGQAVSIVLGPTTPLSPALFRFGADYLCGSVVTDLAMVGEGIRTGLSFRAIKKSGGIRFVTWNRKDA